MDMKPLLYVSALLVLAGCGSETSMARHATFARVLPAASAIILHEGLPHQLYESKQLASEKAGKPTRELHGFPFYSEPLQLDPSDAKRLTELFAAGSHFSEWAGPKKCGGFHPDYAVEWKDGSTSCTVLVCLGCQETKWYGDGTSLYCDIKGDALETIRAILAKYVKNRPPQKRN